MVVLESSISQNQDVILKRVVMVDFDNSRVFKYTPDKIAFFEHLPRPLHPVIRFDLEGLESFAGWFPHEWLTEYREHQLQNWGIEEEVTDVDMNEYDIDTDDRLTEWEKWAYKAMTKEVFTMGDESDAIASRLNDEEAEAERKKRLADDRRAYLDHRRADREAMLASLRPQPPSPGELDELDG